MAKHTFILATVISLNAAGTAQPQQITSTWNGVSGNWTDATLWSTFPFYPNNGNPVGVTYTASMPAGTTGTLTISQNITAGLSMSGGFLNVQSGLFATGGGTSRPITIGATAILQWGNSQLSSGSNLSGPGTVRFVGDCTLRPGASYDVGATEITGSGNLVLFTQARTGSLLVSGQGLSTQSGSTFTVTGPLTWIGSFINAPVIVGGFATIAATSGSLSLGTGGGLQLNGGANWSAGNLTLNNSLIVNSAGSTFLISGDNLLLGAGFVIEPVNNAGILRKQGTSGTTTITNGVQLVNTGTLEVLSGTLYVNQAGANSPGIVNTGTITVGDGATLGGTIQDNSGAIVQGSGTLGVSPSVDRVTLPPTRDCVRVGKIALVY